MSMIPEKNPLYVPFGHYNDVFKIVESARFHPTLLTGPSGVGKTKMVGQICAELRRPMFKVNMTFQTDEDALMGGFRLEEGSTKFSRGAVPDAMEAGGVLLLDEVDLASPLLVMCLQTVLEGEGYFLKRTKEHVRPAPGFQIIATANTKGQGDEHGSFVGTQFLNEAFLDRFKFTFECNYPTPKEEEKMLTVYAKSFNVDNINFIRRLVVFANKIRSGYMEGSNDQTISPRRLFGILDAFAIWNEEDKAVKMGLTRFDRDTQKAMLDIWETSEVGEETKTPDPDKNVTVIRGWKAYP